MKIGIVLDDSLRSGGGVQQYVRTLGAWLIKKGHDVKFISGQTEGEIEFKDRLIEISKNVPLRMNKNELTTPLHPYMKTIIKIIKEENFDVLHVQMPYTPLSTQIFLDLADIPIVGTYHSYADTFSSNFSTGLLSLIQRNQIKSFYKLITVSKAAQEFVKLNFNLDSVLIPCMINVNSLKGKNKIEKFTDHKLNILYLGRMVERKGVIYLLKAYEKLCNEFHIKNMRLMIVGKGSLKPQLENFVKRHRLSGVEFVGFVSETDKANYLATADICVFPAIEGESFGIVLLEAMANSKAIIAGDNKGYRTVMLNEGSFLLVDTKDIDLFTTKLRVLIENEKLREIFANWAGEEVKKYDVEVVGEQILSIYQDAIRKYQKKVKFYQILSPLKLLFSIVFTLLVKIFLFPKTLYQFFVDRYPSRDDLD
ncbi:MAG: glycosyltransferase family 4 protein [bacterium]